jgi:hypothetical protein
MKELLRFYEDVSRRRSLIFLLSKKYTSRQISAYFGYKGVGTVNYHIRKHPDSIEFDKKYKRIFEEVCNEELPIL